MSKIVFVIIVGVFGFLITHWAMPSRNSLFEFKQTVHGSAIELDEAALEKSIYRVRRVSDDVTAEVHSATVVEVKDGVLGAYWYGGTREGSQDTVIMNSTLSLVNHKSESQKPIAGELESGVALWSPSEVVVTREETQQDIFRYVKKLGNPVVTKDPQNRLWLFYVSVSVGGWAGSAINVKVSDDQGQTWGPAKRLVTSPFLNISTLVKGKPFFYEDGTIGLPVYHEFIGKFPEIVRLDINGKVLDKERLWWGRASLQPEVIAISPQKTVAFLRSASDKLKRILRTEPNNVGKYGAKPEVLDLLNPNAGISALRRSGGGTLMVFNNSLDRRNVLSLAHSIDDGKNWVVVHDFECEVQPPFGRFSYPTLIQSEDGHYHMLYTWNRTQIKHVEFNDTWLEGVL